MFRIFLFDKRKTRLDSFFLILLFLFFAVANSFVIIAGTKQYYNNSKKINENFNIRSCSSYLTQKINEYDYENGIKISQLYDPNGDKTTALALYSNDTTPSYITYIYVYKGFLRELVITENSIFSLDAGQKIATVKNFELVVHYNQLLTITYETSKNHTEILDFNLHSAKIDIK
ncbi:DUF4860 domain-containing protein [Lachnobacterium bovis]|uniref:DUF4860 domain-containing protein n=1 Tax=Lachnobacterium bovis TaxID=140626 RepID=A0A1H9TFS5_9FIRM|nr:DUF4860 domain-containing protein [Lachnobacterium bovis]SER95463.1 protein of unknown function [Lachnobacterium bovis]